MRAVHACAVRACAVRACAVRACAVRACAVRRANLAELSRLSSSQLRCAECTLPMVKIQSRTDPMLLSLGDRRAVS